MDAVRRYVFPIIWMTILAVIAASLAKMAFFSDDPTASAEDGVAPTATIEEFATVKVERGDITATLDLPARVEADPGKAVTATHAGEINKVWVANGDRVSKGDRILQVRVPREPAPAPEVPLVPPASPGVPAPTAPVAPSAPATEYTYHTLHAPAGGTIRGLAAVEGQSLEVGGTVATLSPGTYAVVADLTPEQQLRLLGDDITASAELPTTSAPVTCDSPRIEEDDPSEAKDEQPQAPQIDPMTGMPMEATSSAAALRCPVPEKTKVVPGLNVTVTVDLGTSKNVLTVPSTAVEGTLADGAVYLLDDGGSPQRHPVTLGRRGEADVEVRAGLEEGQDVLQFVPGVDNPEDSGMGMQGPMW